MRNFEEHLIREDANIKIAFERLNNVPENLTLFVLDQNDKLKGTLTDGDIRRGFLRGLQLSDCVNKFMTTTFHFIYSSEFEPRQISEIKQRGVKLLPVVDKENRIIRVIDFNKVKTILPLDVVLMAGGRGERLRPLTDNTPKPLLKIGNKSIIEYNIDNLISFGIRKINITIRYLGEQIEELLGSGFERDVEFSYVKESIPSGTIGAVSLIDNFIHDNILVMNADLFTNIDIEDFYNSFINANADLVIATVPYTVDIPYAVLDIEENMVRSFQEKPSFTYHSNAGIYLINRRLLKLIPKRQSFDATDFIQAVLDMGNKVIKFPIIGYWIDIGRPEDYQKARELNKHIR